MMHFHVLCCRSLLREAELAVLYAKLITECLTIADLCLPVVCNSSPEGFLPSTGPGGGAEGHGAAEGKASPLWVRVWSCVCVSLQYVFGKFTVTWATSA